MKKICLLAIIFALVITPFVIAQDSPKADTQVITGTADGTVAGQRGSLPNGTGEESARWPLWVMLGGLFLLWYLFLIRPQQKKEKDRKKMISALSKGDKVMSIGGIYGKVVGVKDEVISVSIADGITIEFTKNAINQVVDKK